MENKTGKYFKYAIGEIILVVIGILIALQINNWNEERLNEKKVQGKLKMVYQELLEDMTLLESDIRDRNLLSQLMFKTLKIIEQETSLSTYNRQVLDSAFNRYKWLDPLFNNTRSYKEFLLTESDFIDVEIYSKLSEYVDQFEETSARVERFAEGLNQAEYDIELMDPMSRKNSGVFVYSFKDIKASKSLFEAIRLSKTLFGISTLHYTEVLEKARDLESKIQNE